MTSDRLGGMRSKRTLVKIAQRSAGRPSLYRQEYCDRPRVEQATREGVATQCSRGANARRSEWVVW